MIRLSPLLALLACSAPDGTGFTQTLTVTGGDGAEATRGPVIETIEGAQNTLRIALPEGNDDVLTEALLAALDRGVEVEVVTDIDHQDDPGIVALRDSEAKVTLADGGLTYYDFSSNADVTWPSTDVQMTSSFVVADRSFYAGGSRFGTATPGPQLVFSGQSEDLCEDLTSEHTQLFGGTDATSLDAYSASAKSIADWRWNYGTNADADLQVWFGPQERLIKRFIDGVYGARTSVYIMSDDIANDGLAHALQEKAADGFDVQVIVGPGFRSSNSLLSRVLETEAPDVVKMQVGETPPTIAIFDVEGGQNTTRRVLVLTHPLWSSSRLVRGRESITDQLADGVLWEIDDWGAASELIAPAVDIWKSQSEAAESL